MIQEGAVEKSSAPNNNFEEGARTSGDADAVQKTTWVVGKGTNPNDADHEAELAPERTPQGGPAKPMPRGTQGEGG
jgi:hypothetical protein